MTTEEILYKILNEIKRETAIIEKDLKIKEAGGRYNEVEHTLFGLGLAEDIVVREIELLNNR